MKLAIPLALLLASIAGTAVAGGEPPAVEVFKSATCGCCTKWVNHLQQSGFSVRAHDVANVSAERQRLGMPERYASCHTAKIGSYLLEGHVPAADVRRLLKEHPKAIGLAVPSMPPGSPGMEGARTIPYDTLLVLEDGSYRVFAHH